MHGPSLHELLHPQYTHYTSHPVAITSRDNGIEYCEVIRDERTADFWTVYGVTPNGEEQAIADFNVRADAESLADCLNEPLVALGRLNPTHQGAGK